MRIERIVTKQGHPVPKEAGYAKGPFPPELLAPPKIITEYTPQPDGGAEDMPIGSTAQNNFKPIKWYKCKKCHGISSQHELSSHECDGVYGDDD